MQIRSANPSDAEILADYMCAMAQETENKALDHSTVRSGILHLINHPELGFYLVAEAPDARIAGMLMITTEWSDWHNAFYWWFQSVYVQPDFRKSGVFRRLFEEVETRARKNPQVWSLRLYVERENASAKATYERLGMKEANYLVYEKILLDSS